MTRRSSSLAGAVLGVLVLMAGAAVVALHDPAAPKRPQPGKRPNIVLVVVDTLRADHLPFMGHARNTAPYLTSLARRGVVFDRAYATSGWTIPSTASIFTSLYPTQHGLVKNLKVTKREGGSEQQVSLLPAQVPTLPEVLRDAGYAGFAVVDNPIVSHRRGFDRGFDRFNLTQNGGAEAVQERVLTWKERLERRQPYFLYLHLNDPHHPYIRRPPYFDEYRADGKVKDLPEGPEVAAYDSEIRWMDDHLRALHAALGWDRDTVVVVTSDHGEEFYEHGETGHSNSLYGVLLNVPLVAWSSDGRWKPGRTDLPVSQVDLLPTLREIAGAAADPRAAGRSLLPILETGRGGDARRALFAHILPFGHGREIRATMEGRWKFIESERGKRELFDLLVDPRETLDRIDAEPGVAGRLAEVYRRFVAAAPRFEGREATSTLDAETEENLRTLGYVH